MSWLPHKPYCCPVCIGRYKQSSGNEGYISVEKAKFQRIDAFKFWCCRRLESPLDSKEIKLVNLEGNKPWIFIGRTDVEAEAPILWPLDAKSHVIGKEPDAGVTQDKMVGWHHWHSGHEFEQTLGDSEGQGSLACCSPWGCKGLNMTWWSDNK